MIFIVGCTPVGIWVIPICRRLYSGGFAELGNTSMYAICIWRKKKKRLENKIEYQHTKKWTQFVLIIISVFNQFGGKNSSRSSHFPSFPQLFNLFPVWLYCELITYIKIFGATFFSFFFFFLFQLACIKFMRPMSSYVRPSIFMSCHFESDCPVNFVIIFVRYANECKEHNSVVWKCTIIYASQI